MDRWDYTYIRWFAREWKRITELLKATGKDFSKMPIIRKG